MAWKYVSPKELNQSHVGKPTKIRLNDGKEIYGSIKKVEKGGIWFIPVIKKTSSKHMEASFFFFPFLFFLPFGFFTPFFFF
ncbi:hypothetical protein JOE21_002853 [Desmospora profundinema]|uniref:Uncharacterized protein n=1 Tax=Desmospora profundinema TaxID=1571184 RepID=A0ABU1IPY7_9BACL|nr:hypothetical protein [Desmospora profundinema]